MITFLYFPKRKVLRLNANNLSADSVRSALDAVNASFVGGGSFGETWKVTDPLGYEGVFAVKLLKTEQYDPRLLQRELDGLGASPHHGLLKLHDSGPVVINGEQRQALLCDFIEGGSVSDAIARGDFPAPSQIHSFAIGLLTAIAELHECDVIHRDIKPDNIMLRNGDWSAPVIIDFGLSRPLHGGTMTLYPSRVGTIPWMSPEQLSGIRARKGADLWACGVILYQLLTRRHPFFYGIDLKAVIGDDREILDFVSVPPPPLDINLPRPLTQVTLRLLTAEPIGERGSARRALNDLRGGPA